MEFLILQRVFADFREDGERVALDFSDVSRELDRNLAEQVYPDSSPLRILSTVLQSAANQLAQADEEIAEALNAAAPEFDAGELSEEDVLNLTEAMRVVPDYFEDWVAHDIQVDIAEIITGSVFKDPMAEAERGLVPGAGARATVIRRQRHRIAGAYHALRSHYDSDEFKAARVVGFYGGGAIGLITLLAKILIF